MDQVGNAPLRRDLGKVRLEAIVDCPLDANPDPAIAVADLIARVFDGNLVGIANFDFSLEERMRSLRPRGQEQKRPLVAKVLEVRQTGPFPPMPFPLVDVDAIGLDELAVNLPRILRAVEITHHVIAVVVLQVAHRELLDEAFNRSRLA